MKLYYIHWADEECCPRRALSLYQSSPEGIKLVHESPKALSHPERIKGLDRVLDPRFVKSLRGVYRKRGDNDNWWWTGKYSLLAGLFLSEEDAREAVKAYVEWYNKNNEECREYERRNHPGRFTEKELAGIYSDVKEKDFAVGSLGMPSAPGKSARIRKTAPTRHCGNCRFRIVEHDLDRREPMGCLYHLDERFYEPMAQVCDLWAAAIAARAEAGSRNGSPKKRRGDERST